MTGQLTNRRENKEAQLHAHSGVAVKLHAHSGVAVKLHAHSGVAVKYQAILQFVHLN